MTVAAIAGMMTILALQGAGYRVGEAWPGVWYLEGHGLATYMTSEPEFWRAIVAGHEWRVFQLALRERLADALESAAR